MTEKGLLADDNTSARLWTAGVIVATLASVVALSSIAGYVVWERLGTRPMQSVRESFRSGRFNGEFLRWAGDDRQRVAVGALFDVFFCPSRRSPMTYT